MKEMRKTIAFRTAKDGLPFDMDDNLIGSLADDEVEIIQFVRPNAERKRMVASVGKDLAKKAKDLILSAEHLRTGHIAIYVRRIGEAEEAEHTELAENRLGRNSPTNVLKRLIERMSEEKKDGSL